MASFGALVRGSFDSGERKRLAGFFTGVGLLHIAGWGLLFAVAAGQPTILALGGLAYTFGLRHAFDADHGPHRMRVSARTYRPGRPAPGWSADRPPRRTRGPTPRCGAVQHRGRIPPGGCALRCRTTRAP